MARLRHLVKARFAIVRKDLQEAMSRLTDADLPWAPKEGMRTVGGQLVEIAGTERQTLTWLKESRHLPYAEAQDFGEYAASVEGMAAALGAVRAETLAYIDSLSEAVLAKSVPFPEGWWESLGLPEAPRSEALRSIAAHEWYHTGQLVSYLWMRGNDPYSW